MSSKLNHEDKNLVSLVPRSQIQYEIERLNSSTPAYHTQMLRVVDDPEKKLRLRKAIDQGYNCEITGETDLSKIRESLNGERGRVEEKTISDSGTEELHDNEDVDLGEFLNYFFREDEIKSVYEVDFALGDLGVWDDSFYIAGYSNNQSEQVKFGPADVFDGPKLKYGFFSVGYDDKEGVIIMNTIAHSRIIHPDFHLEQHLDEDQKVEDMLE